MMRQEEHRLEAFWSNEEQARKHCHVATSPRRNVTTSPRRDVTTSRRLLKILHLIIKCEEARKSRVLECVRPETRNWDLKTLTGGFFLDFCIGFYLFTWLFLDYMMVFFILCILFLSFMMF